MGCCGRKDAAPAASYPRKVLLADGTEVTATSAADERTQRERGKQREREAARTRGYTASR